jgi:hypothetical protein
MQKSKQSKKPTKPKSQLKPGKHIASGTCGDVYEIEGNPKLTIKTPIGYVKRSGQSDTSRSLNIKGTSQEIKDEALIYTKLKLSREKAFLPAKAVKLNKNDLVPGKFIGIIRPKITPLNSKTTYATLEQLRKKIINISHKGIILADNIQAGTDEKGNVFIYDSGFVKKGDPEDAFDINEAKWERLLKQLGKPLEKCRWINPNEKY